MRAFLILIVYKSFKFVFSMVYYRALLFDYKDSYHTQGYLFKRKCKGTEESGWKQISEA